MQEKIKLAMNDLHAMAELLREFEPYVFRISYFLTGHQQDAEDLAQEAMIKISRSLHTFRAESNLKTWIYQLVLNLHRDSLRAKKKVHLTELQESTQSADDFEGKITVKLLVEELLKSMTTVDRQIFILRFLEGFPIKEVAETLGMNESTVKTRMLRLREKIRGSQFQFGGESL